MFIFVNSDGEKYSLTGFLYVSFFFQGKSISLVQVSRLGRSKSLPLLSKCDKEMRSTSCVAQDVLPPDSTRW